MLSETKIKAASILLVQAVGLLTTALFVLFLPDEQLYVVVGALALSGFTSGTTVSNNSAKIYGKISTGETPRRLSESALCLFAYEQVLAVLFVLLLLTIGQDWSIALNSIEVTLLVLVSSTGALVAFVRVKDRYFVLHNVIRAASTLTRLVLVFWLVSLHAEKWIPLALVGSLVIPMASALFFVLYARASEASAGSGTALRPLTLFREYAWGIPVALSRAFINQGLILVAVQLLSADELRMFRFLLLPKDGIGRAFNAFLPLVFDRMFKYSIRLIPSLGIAAVAAAVALVWYAIGDWLFAFGWSAVASFVIYFILNLTVYSVLPIAWRTIHREQAMDITLVVLVATAITALLFWAAAPSSVNGILIAMSIFSFCYILGMLIVARRE